MEGEIHTEPQEPSPSYLQEVFHKWEGKQDWRSTSLIQATVRRGGSGALEDDWFLIAQTGGEYLLTKPGVGTKAVNKDEFYRLNQNHQRFHVFPNETAQNKAWFYAQKADFKGSTMLVPQCVTVDRNGGIQEAGWWLLAQDATNGKLLIFDASGLAKITTLEKLQKLNPSVELVPQIEKPRVDPQIAARQQVARDQQELHAMWANVVGRGEKTA